MVETLVLVVGGITLVATIWIYVTLRRQLKERHKRERAEMEARHERERAELEALHDYAKSLSPDKGLALLHREARTYARARDTSGASISEAWGDVGDAWQAVGDSLRDVIAACPPLEEAQHMTPDEFEAAIERNLELLNEEGVDPLTMEKRRMLIEDGSLDRWKRWKKSTDFWDKKRREWYEERGKDE